MWRMTHPKVKSIMLLVEAMLLDPPPKSPYGSAIQPDAFAQLQSELERLYLDALAQGAEQARYAELDSSMGEAIHADAIALYQEDAKRSDRPWELWEFKGRRNGIWRPCKSAPEWLPGWIYRRRFLVREVTEGTFSQ